MIPMPHVPRSNPLGLSNMAHPIELEAVAFDIYEFAVGKFAERGIDASMTHLVMSSVMARIDGFAIAGFAAQARASEEAALDAARHLVEAEKGGGAE